MFSEQQLGNRIKLARKEAKLKQEEFAERIDVVVQQVSKYENGRDFPTVKRLLKIAEVTGHEIAWFFLEEGQRIENGEKTVTPEEALAVFTELVGQADSKPIAIPVNRRAVDKMRSRRTERKKEQADEA